MSDFLPADFPSPAPLEGDGFRLRPLGPEHNEADYAAWTSSVEHILATPGYEGSPWPHPMTLAENLADLTRHATEFEARTGMTYTVLGGEPETVIGCVYIYPGEAPGVDAKVRSWVRAANAQLDPVLYRTVRDWLEASWPFERIDFAPRPEPEV